MNTSPIRVAVGVILREGQDAGTEVCISLRPGHLHKGGLWEFPGGKVEEEETTLAALKRELEEELGLQLLDAEPMQEILWHYPEKSVLLDVMIVTDFTGSAVGREGQQVRWVKRSDLANYAFPEANQAILDMLSAVV